MLRVRNTQTRAAFLPGVRPRLGARCSRGAVQVRHAESQPPEDIEQRFSLAPSKPATPFGQMLGYILEKQPELFKSAIEDQFLRLKNEKDAREKQQEEQEEQSSSEASEASTDLVLTGLSDRIQQVKDAENRATVEDLMYMCILEEFMKLNVTMLPPAENYTDVPSVNLQPLMEDVHTSQAMDLVREHLMAMMGQAALVPSTAVMKTSKLQMLQVYMFSSMFGYYLRRVDQRFQLAKSAGFVPEDPEDAVKKLERLFTLESDPDEMDSVSSTVEMPDSPQSSDGSSKSQESSSKATKEGKKSALKRYIDSFDAETTKQMSSIMSLEAAKLLNRQTKALWGDLEELTVELREAVGQVTSAEEAQEAFQNAIQHDQVQTVTMFASTQRRAVLEAVAFGTFVRDTEMYVENNFGLLTPNPNQGMGLIGPGGPDEDGPGIEI